MIDEKTVRHVASVARVYLTDEEVAQFSKELSSVLVAFSELKEVDTEGVATSLHPIPLMDVFRDDEVEDSLSKEDALTQTAHKKDDYFMGPRAV